jgi:subtilisin-like proprotein convertase family protein
MKQFVVDKGPLSVAMGIFQSGDYWDGDIYRCANDDEPDYRINHAVIIAGYNDDGGYWIVKNSWGTGWNGNGYFKVGYGECLIQNYVYYADPGPPPGQYRLTMQVSAPGSGTTNPSVGDHWYGSGSSVDVSASANAGWRFGWWSGDCSGTSPSTSVYMDSSKSCTANFCHEGCLCYPSSDVPQPILDNETALSTVNVADTLALTDVNVGSLSITHTYDADLAVFLISPQGTRVELFTGVGSSGDNFTNTALDDECATPITSGTAPFTGCYQPEGSLSNFDGQNSAGVWSLEVTDNWEEDTGTLEAWSLELCGELDQDNDGFMDDKELYIGTDPQDACPDGPSDDAWPFDINMDTRVDILDVLLYKRKLAPNPYDRRYDLNADGSVDILDVLLYKPVLGTSCTNP